MRNIYFLLFLFFLFSCEQDNSVSAPENQLSKDTFKIEKIDAITFTEEEIEAPSIISELEITLIEAGLVDIQSIDSTILVDVRYATENNFMKRVLYPDYHKVYLQKEVAERLSLAQQELKKIDSTLTLKVFDGARPRSVQQEMWDALDSLPVNDRVKFVSNPANGSLHNFGCAVDLTIVNLQTKKELDMGAGYDDLRKIAYPRHEEHFLNLGELNSSQIENRKLLRNVMRAGGFWVIETEWWHFNVMSREKARGRYEMVE